MKELYKFSVENYTTTIMHDHSSVELPTNETDLESGKFYSQKNKKNKSGLIFRQKEIALTKESYIENYGNPLAKILKSYAMLVVSEDDLKCSLKLFTGSRTRNINTPYFMTRKNMMFITVNKKTGDIFHGEMKNYSSKKNVKKNLCKNQFSEDIQKKILNLWKNYCYDDCNSKFHDAIFIFRQTIGEFEHSNTLHNQLLRKYLISKKIKFPNNFEVFYKNNYESRIGFGNLINLKELRKNHNKLIDTVLNRVGLSGRNLKAALHKCENTNFIFYKMLIKIFPKEWLDNNLELTIKVLNYEKIYSDLLYFGHVRIDLTLLSKSELKRAFQILELVLDNFIDFHTFIDHFKFYTDLKRFGEREIKWNAVNIHTFNEEHFRFSELVDHYKYGTYERIYPTSYYDLLQQPIVFEGDVFYPKLLASSEEYNKESSVQSNCVKTYIGKSGSIIVSLRKNNTDSDERATIEFNFIKVGEKILVRNPQFLGRFNQMLDKNWIVPRKILNDRVEKLVKNNYFEPPQIKKTFQNGKVLQSSSDWNDEGLLRWSLVDITQYI